MMKIVVFGANGRVGRRVVGLALEQGHSVSAFVRRPLEFEPLVAGHRTIRVIGGDVLSREQVADVVEGQDAVVSLLSVRGFNPGDDSTNSPTGSMLDAVHNIVGAMQSSGVNQIILVGVSGILPQKNPKAGLIRDLPDYPKVFSSSSAVHLAVHDFLVHTSLNWTIVCPGHMPEGEPTRKYTAAAEDRPARGGITTGDVAHLIVSELGAPRFNRKRVGIAPMAPEEEER